MRVKILALTDYLGIGGGLVGTLDDHMMASLLEEAERLAGGAS
jgi:hypothetical protein